MKRWLPWVFGSAILIGVVIVGIHFSETKDLVRVVQTSRPRWILAATVLQLMTYLAQGEVFRAPVRVTKHYIGATLVYKLSLVKLFMDQALPSAGISSTVFVAKSLQRNRIPRDVVSASMVLNLASYHIAYVVCLVTALAITIATGHANWIVMMISVLFLLFAIGLVAAVIAISAGKCKKQAALLERVPVVRSAMQFLKDADARLTQDLRLLAETSFWQIVIFVLDAATMWVLILALGEHASVRGVYASFMISSLLRTMGVVPGGLGTFEATSVLTLRMIGVAIPVALSATLLFRGLTFWLPMLPGLWLSKNIALDRRQTPRPEAARPEFIDGRPSEGTA
ncbi:MAG TPA: lysylphosphatidylglycerol synthase transmembrane domain-containing protein [Vicinamibacterales bacterium]|nr:lysylphosphatidylglycerol synthase transmembrane domain-containing protein [Vicinamibacterales bacterium]